MGTDKNAVVSAINSSRNITEAAHKLGASRRTLQNRMREFGIPRGKSGRPKELLPYKSAGGGAVSSLLGLALAGAGIYVAAKWWKGRQSTPQLAGLPIAKLAGK